MTHNQNEESQVTSIETKQLSMAQLRATKKSLYAKNNTGFLWTLHEAVGAGRIDLELRPKGQRGSIMYLPPSALDAPGVVRSLANGKISISPEFEDELVALERVGANHSQEALKKFQIELQESPHARAMDVRGKLEEMLAPTQRKRISPAGQVSEQSTIDEFINPSPIRTADGQLFDPKTGEFIQAEKVHAGVQVGEEADTGITSVSLTRPVSLPEN